MGRMCGRGRKRLRSITEGLEERMVLRKEALSISAGTSTRSLPLPFHAAAFAAFAALSLLRCRAGCWVRVDFEAQLLGRASVRRVDLNEARSSRAERGGVRKRRTLTPTLTSADQLRPSTGRGDDGDGDIGGHRRVSWSSPTSRYGESCDIKRRVLPDGPALRPASTTPLNFGRREIGYSSNLASMALPPPPPLYGRGSPEARSRSTPPADHDYLEVNVTDHSIRKSWLPHASGTHGFAGLMLKGLAGFLNDSPSSDTRLTLVWPRVLTARRLDLDCLAPSVGLSPWLSSIHSAALACSTQTQAQKTAALRLFRRYGSAHPHTSSQTLASRSTVALDA